jgi:RNA polymerase sigma-70 factor (ECF subfamily)
MVEATSGSPARASRTWAGLWDSGGHRCPNAVHGHAIDLLAHALAPVPAAGLPAHPRRRDRGQPAVTESFPGEVELVLRARSDPEAFGQLYEHYAPLIFRFVHNRLRDRAVAEDLTSDVFYKALRAIDRYQPTGRPFRAWLYQIASNTITDHLRTRHPALDLDAAGEQQDRRPPVEDQVVQRADVERVRAAVSGLNEAQRTAVSLKLGQDLHTADIAVTMGRSEGAVKLLIHRGLTTIRQRLAERPPVSEGAP